MLQKIREYAQGWVALALVTLIGVTFIFWGVERYNTGSGGQKSVATINGYEISVNEFNSVLERNAPSFADSKLSKEQLRQKILDELIKSVAMSEFAFKEGFRVSNMQIQGLLASIHVFQENGAFSREHFDQLLQRMNYTESDFIQQLRQNMVVNQQQLGIAVTSLSLNKEIQNVYELMGQKRSFSAVVIPYKTFLQDVKLTQEEIQNYYSTHQNDFLEPEKVRLSYILLSLPQIMKTINVSEQEAKQYYQDNIDTFTKPKQWQIAHIFFQAPKNNSTVVKNALEKANKVMIEVKQGKDFKSLAKQYSEDIMSTKNGGVLPWLTLGSLDKSIDATLQTLKLDQVAGPIQTDKGIEIIKLIGIKPETVLPFDQVKANIQKELALENAQKKFADQVEQLSNLAYANPNSLEPVAKTLGTNINSTNWITASSTFKPNENKFLGAKVLAAAFSKNILAGNNSDIINIDPQTVAVVRVLEHQPKTIRPLSSVEASIKELLLNQHAQAMAKQLSQSWLNQLRSGTESLNKLAEEKHLPIMNYSNIGRQAKQPNIEIIKNVFQLAAPIPSAKFSYGTFVLSNGDAVLIKLNEVNQPNPNELNNQQEQTIAENLENNFAQAEYDILVSYILEHAHVKIHKLH